MDVDTCKYFKGLTHNSCEQGIAYRSFRGRIPCAAIRPWPLEERLALCALLTLPTTEEIAREKAEREQEINEYLAQARARAARGECTHCGTPMTAKVQVGSCIYVEPCGCRLGQGRLTDAAGKRVSRLVITGMREN